MPPHICKLTVYLNRTVYSFRMLKGSGRAGKNLAGGSLKYLFTCLINHIFKSDTVVSFLWGWAGGRRAGSLSSQQEACRRADVLRGSFQSLLDEPFA